MSEKTIVKTNKKSNMFLNIQIVISIIVSVSTILLYWFRWDLVEILTPFIEPFLEILMVLIFGVIFLIALLIVFFGLVRHQTVTRRQLIPLVVTSITLLIILFFPFTQVTLNLDFNIHLKEREQVVNLIQAGKLKSDSNFLIHLPKKYQLLSKGGGDIIVYNNGSRTQILFFTYRGVIDNMAGFIYTSDDKKPDGETFSEDFREIVKYKPHWYWVSGT